MRNVALWLVVVGVLIGAFGALWLAGEMHRQNCLTEAQVQIASESESSAVDYGKVFGGGSASGSTGRPSCSRLPF